MNIINKVKDYFNNLDKIGVLNLIKWSLLGLALISMIFVDDKFIGVKGTAIVIFAILFWASLVAFIVMAIIVHFKKKKIKKNKSY